MRRYQSSSMRAWQGVAAVLIGLGALVAIRVHPVAAETTRTVAGYQISFRFRDTPVYAETGNAMLLQVTAPDGTPALGLERDLRLRIQVRSQVSETWDLIPVPATPGLYKVDVILPRADVYTFTVLGTLADRPVMEPFLSGTEDLDPVWAHPRQYPYGAGYVVLGTFGSYLVGLVVILAVMGYQRHRRAHAAPGV